MPNSNSIELSISFKTYQLKTSIVTIAKIIKFINKLDENLNDVEKKHLKADKLGTEGKEGEHDADAVPAVTRAYNIYIYIYIHKQRLSSSCSLP